MSIDPQAGRLLNEHLVALAGDTGATGASVIDEGGWVYGNAYTPAPTWEVRVAELSDMALATLGEHTLNRGGHVHMVRDQELPYGLVESFAGIYLLVLWFDGAFDGHVTRAFVRRALPAIESLLMHLPPEDPTTAVAVRLRR